MSLLGAAELRRVMEVLLAGQRTLRVGLTWGELPLVGPRGAQESEQNQEAEPQAGGHVRCSDPENASVRRTRYFVPQPRSSFSSALIAILGSVPTPQVVRKHPKSSDQSANDVLLLTDIKTNRRLQSISFSQSEVRGKEELNPVFRFPKSFHRRKFVKI